MVIKSHLSERSIESIINYLTVNDIDLQLDMYIKGVGFHSIKPNSVYPAEGHPATFHFNPETGRILDVSALVYIKRGEGSLMSHRFPASRKIREGDVFFLFPREWHSYQPDRETGWDEYWVTFDGSYFARYLHTLVNPEEPILHVGINDRIVELFQEMIYYAREKELCSQHILIGILLHILGHMHSIVRQKCHNSKEYDQIQRGCIMIRENIHQRFTIEEIASNLNMGYSSFRKSFKHFTGISPLQYTLNLKIEKAKEMLINTTLPVKEIAFSLNFDSAGYLSYVFRNKVGMNPQRYRESVVRGNTLLPVTPQEEKQPAREGEGVTPMEITG